MLTREKPPVITESKISHKRQIFHPFEQFVTAEMVTVMFDLPAESIYRIDCWSRVVYVHGKGVSRFVSYADFPPTGGSELEIRDFKRWERRWYNRSKVRQIPHLWVKYYLSCLQQAQSIERLEEWWETIEQFQKQWTQQAKQELQTCYQLTKLLLCRLRKSSNILNDELPQLTIDRL